MSFPPPEPTATFPYRIDRRVGEGAMGVVFRAFEPALERTVAIKVLRAKTLEGRDERTTDEYHRRFLQEARAAAALSHPGSATLYRIGDEAGNPWIAMEWLEGRPLDAVVREDGPLPPERVAQLGAELLSALDAAHKAGVVHRDIKPANLMLLADGRLKVTDFGIARLRGSDLVKTQAGYLLATPRFASPEQLRGQEVDGRSDLFSAGVVLYFLISAAYPFRGDDFLQIATAILTEAPRPLRTLAPHVPPRLAAVIERALEVEPDKRYETAGEMREALLAAVTGV
ncbi:MAG TPA: serine/threonine-protein kinase, partial [Thermoanaerobaculia bacterium]|nr:serine/threonine-protein kinase [Thermoanaerobaculia bacterium]